MNAVRAGWQRLLFVALGAAAMWGCFARPHRGPSSSRDFDPDAVAHAERRMWQAYYEGARVQLFGLLVSTLRDQYNLTWPEALPPAYHFARAAVGFAHARDHYESALPELEAGYRDVESLGHEGFDATALARAELGWWTARRNPATDNPAAVGAALARLYASAYGLPTQSVLMAGVLRARAAAMRDAAERAGSAADWEAVEAMLRESYRSLRAAVELRAPSAS